MLLQVLTALAIPFAAGCEGAAEITVGGSSLLCPLMEAWSQLYHRDSGVVVKYECVGSEQGKEGVASGKYALAVTESLLTSDEQRSHPDLQLLPVVYAPVGIIFNLPGVGAGGLLLSWNVAAGIFSGGITRWDDPRILFDNPEVSLPGRPIEVVAYEGHRGTTEVLTASLEEFGWGKGKGSAWPVPGATLVGGAHGVEEYVKARPYTIGYGGLASIITRGVAFALLQNKQGEVVSPTPSGATLAMSTAVFNATTFPAPSAALGYPIAGASYLIISRNATTKCGTWCAAVLFVEWLYKNTRARLTSNRHSLAPAGDSMASTALTILGKARCTDSDSIHTLGRPLINIPPSGMVESRLLFLPHLYSTVHESCPIVSFTRHGEPRMRWSGDAAPTSTMQSIPFAVEPLVVVANLNKGTLAFTMHLNLATLHSLLSGHITTWSDSRLHSGNRFVPFPNLPIRLVSDSSGRAAAICLTLGCRFGEVSHVEEVGSTAEGVALRPGAVGVVGGHELTGFKLSVVSPALNTTSGQATVSWTSLSSETLQRHLVFSENLETFRADGSLYPFFRLIWWLLPRDSPSCTDAREAGEFMKWSLTATAATVEATARQLVVLRGVSDVVWDTLRCEGEALFPDTSDEESFLVWYIVIGVGSALLAGLAVIIFISTRERRRINELYSTNVLAGKTAEAVAHLDFDGLYYLEELESPDRIQRALRSITRSMKEFMKYIPHHVIHAARGGSSSDDGEEQSVIGVESNCTRRNSKSSRGSMTLTEMADSRVESTNKLCVILAIRRSDEYLCDVADQQGFLTEVLRCVETNKGIIHRLAEDHILAAWGIFRQTAVKSRSLTASLQAAKLNGCTCGVSSGNALCGPMGSRVVKRFTVLGRVVGSAEILTRLAKGTACPTMVSYQVAQESSAHFYTAPFLNVRLCSSRPIRPFILLGQKELGRGEEWMYELDNQDSDTAEAKLTTALNCLVEKQYHAAAEGLRGLSPKMFSKFIAALELFLATLTGSSTSYVEEVYVTLEGDVFAVVNGTNHVPFMKTKRGEGGVQDILSPS